MPDELFRLGGPVSKVSKAFTHSLPPVAEANFAPFAESWTSSENELENAL
jgi:hypothetical protein